jgi:hypothetical protein
MFSFIMDSFIFLAALLYAASVRADEKVASIGEFAAGLMEPVSILNKFMTTGSVVLGIVCIFSAFLRYMQHRVNPMAQPLGNVVFLFLLGGALIGLPFMHLIFDLNPIP